VAEDWTLYKVIADEVEFFHADPDRGWVASWTRSVGVVVPLWRHLRLRYVRDGDGWRRGLL
jgi:hypothetical protein